MTSGGRKRSQRAIVVVGNGNGAAGFAVGKGQNGISALKKVSEGAYQNIIGFKEAMIRRRLIIGKLSTSLVL